VNRLASIIHQLPSHIELAAWAAAVVNEANKAEGSPNSIAACVYNLAFLGLFPGKALGHAYFIPYKGEATLVVGYKGFSDLAYGSGFLKDMHVDVVCQGEEFDYWKDETGPRLKHRPDINREPTRKNIIGAYCLYHTRDGGTGIRLCNKADIAKSDKNRDVWLSNFESMCLKTAVRRASKEWKLTGRMAHAVMIDEQAEREERQSLPDGLIIDGEPIEASSYQLPID
jgi:recombination protein RecT